MDKSYLDVPLAQSEYAFVITVHPYQSLLISINPIYRDFQGYADKEATKKKVLGDVYKKGDLYFRSGDILVMDELGWLYFKDRAGDTFRWKGENVSTMEVEAIVSSVVGLADAVVYGVEIPDTEGRAGMVAIPDPEGKVNVDELYPGLETRLPARGERLLQTHTLIGQEIQLSSSCPIRDRELYQLSNRNMSL